MKTLPQLLTIEGISREEPEPIGSWVISQEILDETPHSRDECEKCKRMLCPPHQHSVQGYDEFLDFDPDYRAFFPNDDNLIGLSPHIKELAAALTGTRVDPVVYADWNQSYIPPEDRRTRQPHLNVLRVIGETVGGNVDGLGSPELCPSCESVADLRWFKYDRLASLKPSFSRWDGSDLFRIRGLYRVYLTAEAWEKMNHLGFTNLQVSDATWWLDDN